MRKVPIVPSSIPIAVERAALSTMWLPMGCDLDFVIEDRAPTAKMPDILSEKSQKGA